MKKMVNFTPSVFEGFFGTCLNNIPLLELQHCGMFGPSKDLSFFFDSQVSQGFTDAGKTM